MVINENKRMKEKLEVVTKVQSKIIGCPNLLSVNDVSFVGKFNCMIASRVGIKKRHTIFLFSHMAVLTSYSPRKFKEAIYYPGMRVSAGKEGEEQTLVLENRREGSEKILYFKTTHRRNKWHLLLSSVIDAFSLRSQCLLAQQEFSNQSITIEIKEAIELLSGDITGQGGIYGEITVGGNKVRTRVISRSPSASWDESFSFAVRKPETDKLYIDIFNKGTPDVLLGSTSIAMEKVKYFNSGETVSQWLELSITDDSFDLLNSGFFSVIKKKALNRNRVPSHAGFLRVLIKPTGFEDMEKKQVGNIALTDVKKFVKLWDSVGIDSGSEVSMYRPIPPTPSHFILGHYALPYDTQLITASTEVIKKSKKNKSHISYSVRTVETDVQSPLIPPLQPPLTFIPLWVSPKNKSKKKCTIWEPVPPLGYVSLGNVVTTGNQPDGVDIPACVHSSLVKSMKFISQSDYKKQDKRKTVDHPYKNKSVIWKNRGKVGKVAITLWRAEDNSIYLKEREEDVFSAGCFICTFGHNIPVDNSFYLLKLSQLTFD
eukprot:CAMPEP_0174275274 /NCGR_PEP_ID=MMETSP0439-20130205/59736_1 /TAXON_ID=0 /ORGANISM="Stereomyxa ramosa, Strain Chinc5" /LENGTH=541 /DNA_ID=CAMNT_0015367361 /DNA_START=1287 /DNA_END=2912 /DNA_ORIENTATION=+